MLRAYFGLIRKEFIQVRRDSNMLSLIFLVPIIQLMLLGYAVNTDVKLLATDIYDFDQSQLSREFVQSFKAGDYFLPSRQLATTESKPLWELDQRFKTGDAEVALILPEDFSEQLSLRDQVTVGLIVDGADANAARSGLGYAGQIAGQFSRRVTGMDMPLELKHKVLYNPELESVYYMVPGIVATLLTMITIMLTSMAIVREKEMGTLEQISVTPISGTVLLLGKTSTFALLGMFEMTIVLTVGILWFGIPFVGSAPLLYSLALLYLLTTLGIGMFFSTITSTQQQAMFLAWFFTIFAILTSGFFTPISNMPDWMQKVTYLNPMRYFMEIVRGILMKGSGLFDLWPQVATLVVYGVTVFSFSIMRFNKRVA